MVSQYELQQIWDRLDRLENPIVTLKVKIVHPDAKLPTQAHAGEWFDLCNVEEINLNEDLLPICIHTGLAFELPDGYDMIVAPRSSSYVRYGFTQGNSIGVIDNGYRGEIKIYISLDDMLQKFIKIPAGTRLFQARLVKRQPNIILEQVEELGESDRGEGGFGSSGT